MQDYLTTSQRRAMRTAGLLYMLMAITAPIGLLYVPGELVVPGDAAATAENVRTSGWLLRLGIGSELIHQAIAVFLVLALYRLFRPVNEDLARLLVVLGALVSVPIMFLNTVNEIAAMILASGPDYLTAAFAQSQLDALVMLFLRLHDEGIIVASVFWGLWLFPFGLLIIQSGFIPRLLGVLLLIAGVGYVVASGTAILLPVYAHIVDRVALILEMGEIPIVFWLLIRGLWPSRRAAEAAG